MKKSRFMDSQTAFILRQAKEGISEEEICSQHLSPYLLPLAPQERRADAVGDETAWNAP